MNQIQTNGSLLRVFKGLAPQKGEVTEPSDVIERSIRSPAIMVAFAVKRLEGLSNGIFSVRVTKISSLISIDF